MFGALGLHEIDGSVTVATWLRHRAQARRHRGVGGGPAGRQAPPPPGATTALVNGLLSGGAVDVVLAQVLSRHLDLFAEHEPQLVPTLVGLDIDAVTTIMREWRARADAIDPGPAPAEKPDTLHLSPTLDDRGVINGSLGTDLYNLTNTALRVADTGDLTVPLAERRALAFGQILQTFLDFNPDAKHRRHRPHLNVTMTYEQWCQLDTPRRPPTSRPPCP